MRLVTLFRGREKYNQNMTRTLFPSAPSLLETQKIFIWNKNKTFSPLSPPTENLFPLLGKKYFLRTVKDISLVQAEKVSLLGRNKYFLQTGKIFSLGRQEILWHREIFFIQIFKCFHCLKAGKGGFLWYSVFFSIYCVNTWDFPLIYLQNRMMYLGEKRRKDLIFAKSRLKFVTSLFLICSSKFFHKFFVTLKKPFGKEHPQNMKYRIHNI